MCHFFTGRGKIRSKEMCDGMSAHCRNNPQSLRTFLCQLLKLTRLPIHDNDACRTRSILYDTPEHLPKLLFQRMKNTITAGHHLETIIRIVQSGLCIAQGEQQILMVNRRFH